jgi:hypothetical protein
MHQDVQFLHGGQKTKSPVKSPFFSKEKSLRKWRLLLGIELHLRRKAGSIIPTHYSLDRKTGLIILCGFGSLQMDWSTLGIREDLSRVGLDSLSAPISPGLEACEVAWCPPPPRTRCELQQCCSVLPVIPHRPGAPQKQMERQNVPEGYC